MSRKRIKSEAVNIVNYLKRKKENFDENISNNEFKEEVFVHATDFDEIRDFDRISDSDKIIDYDEITDNRSCATKNHDIKQKLAEWSTVFNIRHNALNALLKILQPMISGLPLDGRSLKKTPRTAPVTKINGGEYVHYGVADCLTDFFEKNSYKKNLIELNINIDGLPLFASSKMQTWPILININNTLPVLVAGIFTGNSKAENVNEYLNEFITELHEISENGFYYKNKKFEVRVRAFICDAPARSFVLGVKGHTGYNSCIKCKEKGKYFEHRITFCLENNASRSDAEYRKKTDADFHIINAPMVIEKLSIDVTKQFALDYMHIVCLGVVKTLLHSWTKVKRKDYSLSNQQITMLESNLLSQKSSITKEFARKPRGISSVPLIYWANRFEKYINRCSL